MEFIVNQINFSKDSVLKIADDFAGETIHPDVKQVTSVEFAEHSSVKINRPIMAMVDSGSNGFATNPGAGFSASPWSTNDGTVGQV